MTRKGGFPSSSDLPQATQLKLRSLLSYNPETAGRPHEPGLRRRPGNFDGEGGTRAVKTSPTPPQAAGVVFVTDERGRLEGTALVVDLLRSKSLGQRRQPPPSQTRRRCHRTRIFTR